MLIYIFFRNLLGFLYNKITEFINSRKQNKTVNYNDENVYMENIESYEKIKSELPKYKQFRRIMVFDVETTGLIPTGEKIQKDIPYLDQMPHILQLSFIEYDVLEKNIINKFDSYICVSENITIDPFITELTGITREKCDSGVSIIEGLTEFYKAYMESDCVIAHNIKFDSTIILYEIERYFHSLVNQCPHILSLFDMRFNRLMKIYNFCTMKESIDICNIMISRKTNPEKKFKKFPKLKELYFTLFCKEPENLHNSIIDVLCTLRCFLRFKMHIEIHDEEFNYYLKSCV